MPGRDGRATDRDRAAAGRDLSAAVRAAMDDEDLSPREIGDRAAARKDREAAAQDRLDAGQDRRSAKSVRDVANDSDR